jgi:DNA-directed RNA polymerase subunit beta'
MPDGSVISGMVDCTLGRILFNEIIPQDLGFVDRTVPENILKLEIDFQCGKKQLKKILDRCISVRGTTHTAEVLDDVKALGYKYSTIGALSVSISDMTVPPEKPQILEEAQDALIIPMDARCESLNAAVAATIVMWQMTTL